MEGLYNRQAGCLVRAVETTDFLHDKGLIKKLENDFWQNRFGKKRNRDFRRTCKKLLVGLGDTVVLPILAGSNETDIFSSQRELVVNREFSKLDFWQSILLTLLSHLKLGSKFWWWKKPSFRETRK